MKTEQVFDDVSRDYMIAGAGAAVVGTATQVALSASGVALSTTTGTMTIASAGTTTSIPLLALTGWGVVGVLSKALVTIGGGMFVYGFGRGLARGVSAYRAEHRATKAELSK